MSAPRSWDRIDQWFAFVRLRNGLYETRAHIPFIATIERLSSACWEWRLELDGTRVAGGCTGAMWSCRTWAHAVMVALRH